MSVYGLASKFSQILADNAPSILAGIGVAGVATTAVLAGKASYEAALKIDHLDRADALPKDPKERTIACVKEVWKLYIPAASMGAVTIAGILLANRIGNKRAAALAAAYSLSESSFETYREKVVERLGKGKELAVRDEIAQDHIRANPPNDKEVIVTGNGNVLCYDSYTGRYFMSSMEKLKSAQNELNHQLVQSYYVCLTDFYYLIGLPPTKVSDEVGWRSDKLIELKISATISEGDTPCLVIDWDVAPVRNYYKEG